jgi:tripartite-type tricarboxylate transporter receptor subunit TctC
MYRLRIAGFAALLALAAVFGSAFAQKYPTKPVRLVVPFTPGGGTDMIARLIAQKMSEVLGQSVVVDNRGGGGGTIGAETGLRATPDGYTLLLLASSYASNAVLHKLPYDPIKDLQPIILVGETGFLIVTHPSVPAKTIKELIDLAKARPGTLNYASPGIGSSPHLTFELLKSMAGIDVVHVPYKGSGPAMSDLLGGQLQMMITGVVTLIPHVRSGRLRGIAVTSAKRSAALPDVPTVGETVPGYEAAGWYGFCGPKGVPEAVVSLWNREVNKILQTEEMKKRLEVDALEPVGGPPEQLLNTIKRDIEKWKKVVKEAKITVS